jgi:hypothetical protein
MDPRERVNNLFVGVRAAAKALEADIWTALPGIVQSFTASSELTVSVQPAIRVQQRLPNGMWNYITLPVLIHCPVLFSGGGGFVATFPISKNDEGLIIFSSRCIDNWWVQGGVQNQAELRMHDLSDGFFLPRCFSNPNVPPNISTSTAQLRTLDGTCYVEIAEGGVINLVAPGGVNINGNATITGNSNITGNTEITGNAIVSGSLTAAEIGTGG